MLRKIVDQRQPGSEKRVRKLWPEAVMGGGCQGTCLEDRWDVYTRAAVEGRHSREETKLEATLGPQTAPPAGVIQFLLPSSPASDRCCPRE